ncbi:hypothetical protein GCM10020369_18660 [Cryptosporangium minutisporangium]|uniref:Uncharacterized protein n=1 Tax=Cryptosporangium minutisporangium TaxID=113569 RepID=A0ABP6SVU6_9ACTN
MTGPPCDAPGNPATAKRAAPGDCGMSRSEGGETNRHLRRRVSPPALAERPGAFPGHGRLGGRYGASGGAGSGRLHRNRRERE